MMLPYGQALFQTIRELGEGGLGKVDEILITSSNCPSLRVGQRLARKRLNDHWKNDQSARLRFEREIKLIRQMSHPQIISFEGENIEGNDERFYAMPLFPKSLRDVLNARGSLPLSKIIPLAKSIVAALIYAHERGFFHRDLKPENILIGELDQPVVSDWGLGKFIHKESTVLNLTQGGMGTEYYCSPEQWLTGEAKAPGDVYSLGMLLAELAKGRQVSNQAWQGIQTDVLTEHSLSNMLFNKLIKDMTQPQINKRIGSMQEVSIRLTAI